MVEALARSTQTDPGMAAMFSLGVLSAAVSRRYALQTSRGINHLNLWVIVVAESGEGKSSVLGRLTEPLDLIQQAAQSASPDLPRPRIVPPSEPLSAIDRLLSDDDIIDGARPAPEVDPDEVLLRMQAEQERRYPGVPLNFATRDATPQAVAEMLGSQYMPILQASSEGGFSTWISANPGRATGDLATLNMAWDGSSQPAAARVGRDSRPIERACLSMIFAPQRDSFQVATAGRTGKLLRETGYLARCLYYFPESNIGRRRAPFEQLSPSAVEEYRACVWSLLGAGTERTETVRLLKLSGSASLLYDGFFNDLEPRLAPGGDLKTVSSWIERLRQSTLRIGGLLHLALHLGEANSTAVAKVTMENAIAIAQALLPHGLRALGAALPPLAAVIEAPKPPATTPSDSHTRVLAAARRRFPAAPFGARDIHRSLQTSHSAAAVTEALDRLVEQGVLVREQIGQHPRYRFAEPILSDSDT
jgi:hypothetical protein